jgi:hypothetical protein
MKMGARNATSACSDRNPADTARRGGNTKRSRGSDRLVPRSSVPILRSSPVFPMALPMTSTPKMKMTESFTKAWASLLGGSTPKKNMRAQTMRAVMPTGMAPLAQKTTAMARMPTMALALKAVCSRVSGSRFSLPSAALTLCPISDFSL